MNSTLLFAFLAALALPLFLAGCSTMRGLGDDISNAGRGLERAAEDASGPPR